MAEHPRRRRLPEPWALHSDTVHAAHASPNALYGLGPDAASQYPARVQEVAGEDVLRVARRIVDLDRYTEAVIRGS